MGYMNNNGIVHGISVDNLGCLVVKYVKRNEEDPKETLQKVMLRESKNDRDADLWENVSAADATEYKAYTRALLEKAMEHIGAK
jgi:hypothetical protein